MHCTHDTTLTARRRSTSRTRFLPIYLSVHLCVYIYIYICVCVCYLAALHLSIMGLHGRYRVLCHRKRLLQNAYFVLTTPNTFLRQKLP